MHRRREPIRRDSLKRRELLLKGKEGSRRRQRWENDRLLNNPYAQPPLPSDWEVRPTYPVHNPVPYFLAPLWDAEYKARSAVNAAAKSAGSGKRLTQDEIAAGRVPRELREKLKRSRGAKGLLQDLEEEVRTFITSWEAKSRQLEDEGVIDGVDSEDEEIVFVGRNGGREEDISGREKKLEEGLKRDKLIFQGLVDDNGAAFGFVSCDVMLTFLKVTLIMYRRWLVHSIAAYYGLKTWSVTNGGLREAYIGLNDAGSPSRVELPRPLYGLV